MALPQFVGYQTQRFILQPGFPSHYIIALIEGVCVKGKEGQVQASCQNQAICQVRTDRSGGDEAQKVSLWQCNDEDTWL